MTRRRLGYPTRMAVGPYRLVRFRHTRGFAILDDRTGQVAYTAAHPVTGRPTPAFEPDPRQPLRIATDLASAQTEQTTHAKINGEPLESDEPTRAPRA